MKNRVITREEGGERRGGRKGRGARPRALANLTRWPCPRWLCVPSHIISPSAQRRRRLLQTGGCCRRPRAPRPALARGMTTGSPVASLFEKGVRQRLHVQRGGPLKCRSWSRHGDGPPRSVIPTGRHRHRHPATPAARRRRRGVAGGNPRCDLDQRSARLAAREAAPPTARFAGARFWCARRRPSVERHRRPAPPLGASCRGVFLPTSLRPCVGRGSSWP